MDHRQAAAQAASSNASSEIHKKAADMTVQQLKDAEHVLEAAGIQTAVTEQIVAVAHIMAINAASLRSRE